MALREHLIFGKLGRSIFCWSKCIFLVSYGPSGSKKCFFVNFRRFMIFVIFTPPLPFGKISLLASLVEVLWVGLNAYFWCPTVSQVLKMIICKFYKIQDF